VKRDLIWWRQKEDIEKDATTWESLDYIRQKSELEINSQILS